MLSDFRSLSHKTILVCAKALFVGLLASGIYSQFAASKELPQQEKVLLLKQSTALQGAVKTYVGRNAIKVCFTNFHGHLIAKAPTWKVAIVNEEDKTVFETDYDTWMKHQVVRNYFPENFTEPGNLMQMLDVKATTYAGKSCRQSIFDAYPCKAKFFGLSRKDVTDEKACLIMEKWFATPFNDSIPIAFRYFNSQGAYLSDVPKKDRITAMLNYVDPLQCTSVESVNCPDNFFAYPTNFKKVKNEKIATDSTSKQNLLNDLFDSGIVK